MFLCVTQPDHGRGEDNDARAEGEYPHGRGHLPSGCAFRVFHVNCQTDKQAQFEPSIHPPFLHGEVVADYQQLSYHYQGPSAAIDCHR